MTMLRSILLFCCFLSSVTLGAASPAEAVRAADTARVMATIAGDVARLAPRLSDQLSYGHSDGGVQTKAEFLGAVQSNRIKYEAYDYEEVQVVPVADGVATMTGRARLRASAGGQQVAFSLRFLAVWRQEDGAWRLLAYQSARLPEAATP
jgi:ketosteroid isomerase-like protein